MDITINTASAPAIGNGFVTTASFSSGGRGFIAKCFWGHNDAEGAKVTLYGEDGFGEIDLDNPLDSDEIITHDNPNSDNVEKRVRKLASRWI